MNLNKCIFTKNDCYKKGLEITPIGIVVHSTGCNNPALKRYVQPDDGKLGVNTNKNDWNTPGLNVCVHAFIGKLQDGTIATYQTLPWDMRSWGCGSGKKGSYNNSYIQFEICEDALKDKTYFNKVYKEAVELCVYLIEMFPTIKVSNIVCHKEAHALGYASGHEDVMHWFPKFGKSMDTFKKDVQALLDSHKLNGLVKADDGNTYYYKNGEIQKVTTLINSDGIWHYVKDGKVDFTATTLIKYNNTWFYVEKGVVNFSAVTLCKYNNKWYYVNKGKVDFTATTLCKYGNKWYYVSKGVVDFNSTTLCKYNDTWWYVEKGIVNFDYNGIGTNSSGDWYIKKGKVIFSANGLYEIKQGTKQGWYYFKDGKVDYDTTTLVQLGKVKWYVTKGMVDFTYTGKFTFNGKVYDVVKGKAIE